MRRWEREKESRKRKESKVEEPLPPKPEQKIRVPEEVRIPVVRLEKPKIEVKIIEIDGKVPEIKEESVEVKIPIITLEKPEVRFRQVKLDCELPKVQVEERKLNIPLIRLSRPREVRCIIHTFDSRLPQIRPRSKVLIVPIYRTPKYIVREAISSFDSKVNSQILQLLTRRIEEVEEIRDKLNVKTYLVYVVASRPVRESRFQARGRADDLTIRQLVARDLRESVYGLTELVIYADKIIVNDYPDLEPLEKEIDKLCQEILRLVT